jgi:hypothetical protein
MALISAGQGATLGPLTASGIAGVAAQDAGAASGLVNVAHQLGGSLGLGVLVTVFAAASTGTRSAGDLLAYGVGVSLAAGSATLTLALVLVVVLIVRPRARAATAADTSAAARLVEVTDRPGPVIATPSDATAGVEPAEAQDKETSR